MTHPVPVDPDPAAGSDDQLIERIRAGEVELFERLLRRHNQRAFRAARAIVRDDAEAEDVVQEAWVRAYAHLREFAGRSAFSTWLTRIVINEAYARLRRQRRSGPPVEEGDLMSTDLEGNPEDGAWRHQLGGLLERAIDRLPLGHRAVLMLRMVEQLSVAETAACLDVSEEVVRTRLHRARAALRRDLLEQVDTDAGAAFGFAGHRCDRITAAVMARIAQ